MALLHRWAEDHVAPDPHQRRLRPSLEWGHLDDQVAPGRRPAGQPPAIPQLVAGEGAWIDVRHRDLAGYHPHPALLARAVTATRGVDRDRVPACRVEYRGAARNPDLGAVREKAQTDPFRPIGRAAHGLVHGRGLVAGH